MAILTTNRGEGRWRWRRKLKLSNSIFLRRVASDRTTRESVRKNPRSLINGAPATDGALNANIVFDQRSTRCSSTRFFPRRARPSRLCLLISRLACRRRDSSFFLLAPFSAYRSICAGNYFPMITLRRSCSSCSNSLSTSTLLISDLVTLTISDFTLYA